MVERLCVMVEEVLLVIQKSTSIWMHLVLGLAVIVAYNLNRLHITTDVLHIKFDSLVHYRTTPLL
jgi:hypothetical protein